MVMKFTCVPKEELVIKIQPTSEWTCLYFDPLDDSDTFEDADLCVEQASEWGCGDGFDVNRDGEIDLDERYTNSEEYWFGTPSDWLTERDGLWCAGIMPNLHPDACQDEIVRPTGDDGWLGSDLVEWTPSLHLEELLPTSLAVPGDGILMAGRHTMASIQEMQAMRH